MLHKTSIITALTNLLLIIIIFVNITQYICLIGNSVLGTKKNIDKARIIVQGSTSETYLSSENLR